MSVCETCVWIVYVCVSCTPAFCPARAYCVHVCVGMFVRACVCVRNLLKSKQGCVTRSNVNTSLTDGSGRANTHKRTPTHAQTNTY